MSKNRNKMFNFSLQKCMEYMQTDDFRHPREQNHNRENGTAK